MKEIRNKLKENEKELRKSVKEGSAFNTGKLLNIVANLIEYALNTHTHASSIASELEDLQCKNEINKSLESKKTYSIDEAFKTFDIKFIDDIKTFCITNIIGIDQFNKNSEFCRGQLFAFKNILSMIKKQESEAKDGSKSK